MQQKFLTAAVATTVSVLLLTSVPAAASPPASSDQEPIYLAAERSELTPAHETANRWIDEGDTIEPRELVEQVRRGDTLMTLLARAGITGAQAHEAIRVLRTVYNPRELKPGQEVRITLAPSDGDEDSGDLHGLSLQASIERDVAVRRDLAGGFQPVEIERVLKASLGRGGAMIESSLFRSGTAAGIPIEVILEIFKAFSYDVDFQRDLQPGDLVEVLYEQTHDEAGRLARTGNVLFASLGLSGSTLRLYRFEPQGGEAEYFNSKGESVKKALLKTPIDGAKLTSSFGMRSHPILGYSILHRGIDFGAQSGTPIMAAGDGVIDKLGLNGGYGNFVKLRHNPQYSTAYAHMSRFAAGLKPGSRVKQGQVIGYVGTTGLSTGPHLHYEVLVNDKQVNPLSIKMPTGRQLEGPELKRFRGWMAEIERRLQALPDPLQIASYGAALTPVSR